jgi:TRAP-type C4-dicarboxylate transport system permease small subunit
MKLKQGYELINSIFIWIGNISILIVMLIFLVDVIGRAVFNKPLYASNEMVELVMVILGLSVMYATKMDSHIKVDVIVPRFKERIQIIIRSIGSWLTFGISGIIAFALLRDAFDQITGHQVAVLLGIPVGYFTLVFAISLLWSALISLLQAINPRKFLFKSLGGPAV